MRERLTFKNGEVQQSNFHDYPVLRMADAPKITTKVIVTDNKPGGIGEAGVPPVAPAVANAVYKLTGKRLRDLPFKTGAAKGLDPFDSLDLDAGVADDGAVALLLFLQERGHFVRRIRAPHRCRA